MMQRLTDRIVKALPAPAHGNRIRYEGGEVKGFGVRITAGGSRAFILNYRRKSDGLERRYTVGTFPVWSVTAAREESKRLKRIIDGGGDPVGDHRAERAAPTVVDLAARFLEEHVAKQSPSTQGDYRSMLQRDVLPVLGTMKAAAVEFEHIERLHTRISKRAPIRANRMLTMAAKMFALAVKWKLRPDNPTKGVTRNREDLRRRYLKPDELVRLTKALAKDPNQQAADIFRMLLLTGARRGEVLSAAWDQFDLEAGTWTKPASSTKQRREHNVPLSAPARQLLARLDRSTPFVFPGRGGDQPREDLKYDWARICKAAKIENLRIHDLRHSFASHLVSAGFNLPLIGSLLGHATPTTTARYAHLLDDPLRVATERVGAIVAGAAPAEILPFREKQRWKRIQERN